jgi:DNA-binding GntR family transcriptional regulator
MTKRASSPASATVRAVDELREMMIRRKLMPGEQVRQEELAEMLGISRSPLREALRTLENEGFVRHAMNQGYFVTRLSAGELNQIYLMRRLLEEQVLRSAERPSEEQLAALSDANAAVAQAAADGAVIDVLVANRQFHFEMFALSPLDLVIREVERLWNLSESYRAAYLWLPETKRRIVDEHGEMVDALRAYDLDRLVSIVYRHTEASREAVIQLLS